MPVIDIEDKRKDIEAESELSKECTRQNDATAYMIFTSGSTGNPKGVMISDNNVLRLFSNTENLYRFSSEDVWTMFHSVAFDFSVWEIWGALLYGGELVIVPYKTSRTVDAFLELLLEKKVTVLNQTPSAFRQLLQCDRLYEPETVEQMNLKYIIFGGEALDFGMLEQWMNAYGDTNPTLVNMYGITETTVHVTYEVLDKEKIKDKRRSLIGMPIRDLQIYVLDDKMRMVPDGVVGEMYVGGAGVSKGYWNREELTASRFIQNPFTDKADRLYKTGDLAVRYPGGELEYIGRNDEQVKVKGFRIELNEIQEKINENEIVKDNIVVLDKSADAFAHLDQKEAPLSYAQNRMWFLHQFDDGDDSYNMHIVLKMDGELVKEALMYSISKIVERHESLRTNFKMDDSGELKQHVREISEVQIENVDVSEMEEAEISEVIENEISKPFDLEKDLLIRAALLTKSDECNYLVAVMHHMDLILRAAK